ncbi:hypothetical protein HPB51_006322 [Rhipicephalus microplus]|uniref:Apple domain-containing protein n=1 Tax=Rhipicephalus microplus TaxID=6941 RepID=A0A9J6EMI6_RHIMP|nr:hypothetical protein HPB51_006322 [Rhipicephalus microplus]
MLARMRIKGSEIGSLGLTFLCDVHSNPWTNFAGSDASCSQGKPVFMLATNARLDSDIFSREYGVNLTACAEACRRDARCRSLTFVKNATDSYCQLMGAAADASAVVHERTLSPVNGVYYLEKICLQGEW